MARTGTGIGGSGGAKFGRVESAIVKEGDHLLPFERVQECASLLAPWFEKQIQDFKLMEQFLQEHDSGRSEQDMKRVSKLWSKNVQLDPNEKRKTKSRL